MNKNYSTTEQYYKNLFIDKITMNPADFCNNYNKYLSFKIPKNIELKWAKEHLNLSFQNFSKEFYPNFDFFIIIDYLNIYPNEFKNNILLLIELITKNRKMMDQFSCQIIVLSLTKSLIKLFIKNLVSLTDFRFYLNNLLELISSIRELEEFKINSNSEDFYDYFNYNILDKSFQDSIDFTKKLILNELIIRT